MNKFNSFYQTNELKLFIVILKLIIFFVTINYIPNLGFQKNYLKISKNIPNQLNHLKGTPLCCPPEIISGNFYAKSGDIYSFGLSIYEIITN